MLNLISALTFTFAFWSASASVTVRKTSQGPTGFEVDFHYYNTSAQAVTIAGGFTTFTDQYHAIVTGSASYDPHYYQPGWFRGVGANNTAAFLPYHMDSDGRGNWNYTTPLPSGTYSYAFLVDCPPSNSCTIDTGRYIIDQDNPPFQNVQGEQIASRFQVPFDAEFQSYEDLNLNFDYQLPVSAEHQGTVTNVNYSSPGSVLPAPDVHDFAVYLPKEYGTIHGKQYHLMYLSHGGGGDGQDWENLAAVSHILDRLIMDGHIPPTVVVMPSFYNIEPQYNFTYGSSAVSVAPSAQVVRENYMAYLFPFVQANFAVSSDPAMRGFSGLSLGSILTYEMFINATDYFNYYGLFSGVLGPAATPYAYFNASQLAARPSVLNKGIFTCAGLYDIAFNDVRSLQTAFQALGVPYYSRIAPYGYHYWNTWADCMWRYGQTVLWRQLPLPANPIVQPRIPT